MEGKTKTKIIYTILFFIDTLVLIMLAFLFLKELDEGLNLPQLLALTLSITVCISLQVLFIVNYTRLPVDKEKSPGIHDR
jgi:hypothetical protein